MRMDIFRFGKITYSIWVVGLILVFVIACKRDVEDRTNLFPALSPTKLDTAAGNWSPVLLSSPEEFTCAAPILTSNTNYKLELLEIKSWQQRLTSEELEQIRYWSAGTVLRWNEILRELVAKYNLPPYQNPDGSYPIPSAANPLAYPLFPFANPPYSARAYAYVSVAQYDAAVAAYHYKSKFKRPRPFVSDPSIKLLIPIVNDFAYPSEEAVVSGAAATMLKLLFPGDQDYIEKKLQECLNVRIMVGANTRSETEAGVALGEAVASKFVNRARNDRASKAVGTPADWKKLSDDVIARGEIPWVSLETPPRPPMLPMFGRVIGMLLDTADVIAGRPAPPPAVNSAKFNEELEEVRFYSKNATRERMKIVHFWADGAGTYTPPGHWNAIACEDFVNQNFSEARWARNLALINMAMFDAAICCWDVKMFYFNPRPSQVDPSIKTLTGVPNFPAYTSGHSTFSGAAASVLAYIIPSKSAEYLSMADEASKSRLYGAIHYRSDIEVGMDMGKAIGAKAVFRAKNDGADK